MKINRSFRSPNFDPQPIIVEFVVIHYTACNLQSTFDIFRQAEKKASSHLIVSNTGEVYEAVDCWEDKVLRAWHSGKSRYKEAENEWQNFNDFSIGIELVNLNGNIFNYSEKQYESLSKIITHLKKRHKALKSPSRIIGHEQISAWRGKIDPGWMFDWKRLFTLCYPGIEAPERKPALPEELREIMQKFIDCSPQEEMAKAKFWQTLNETLETAKRVGS